MSGLTLAPFRSPALSRKREGQWSFSLLLLLTALLPSALHAAAEPTIMVFGDSISAAYGMRAEQGWVALLQKKLATEAHGWRVVNASISGETTDGGIARLPRALKVHQPKIVVLELGANDGLRGLPPAGMKTNLQNMIKSIQAAGAQVVLIGLPLPVNYGAVYTKRFAAVFEELARHHQLPYVPFALQDAAGSDLLQEDGLHPSVAAQPRLLAAIWPALETTIRNSQIKIRSSRE